MDLQGSAVPETRFFVHDMSADGLQERPGARDPFDVVYDTRGGSMTFSGDGHGAGITEREYRRLFTEQDQH